MQLKLIPVEFIGEYSNQGFNIVPEAINVIGNARRTIETQKKNESKWKRGINFHQYLNLSLFAWLSRFL